MNKTLANVAARPFGPVLTVLALLLVAGCEEGPSTQRTDLHAAGSLSFLADATRNGGPLLLQVSGDPYGGPPEALAVVLRALLEGALEKRPTRLTLEPGEAEDPAYRLRVTFNGGGLGAAAHCRGEGRGGGPEGRVEILASFCHQGRVLAGVKGWVEGTEHHGDARFERLIRQVALELFVKEEKQR
jgi:hypothetical protein